jgi:hypothetical protein
MNQNVTLTTELPGIYMTKLIVGAVTAATSKFEALMLKIMNVYLPRTA